jgi:hypothetical protein
MLQGTIAHPAQGKCWRLGVASPVMSELGWPKADMAVRDSDVRFWGQSGHPRSTNLRDIDGPNPIRGHAKPDRRTHTPEVPHTRREDIHEPPLAAALQ